MSDIQKLFHSYVNEGGELKVTSFKTYLNELINTEIKPLCGRSGKSADGTDWRSQLKSRFSGKGAKWVLVPINEVSLTISQFEADGINCDNYKTFIELKGAAWVRFSGPRLDTNGQQAAAFEVRTGGSKIDHPKQLHYIPVSVLDETVRPMEGTPHSLKLETLIVDEFEGVDEGCEELELSGYELNPYDDGGSAWAEESDDKNEAVANEAPTSDDPEEWEAFLESQGLLDPEFDGDFNSEDLC